MSGTAVPRAASSNSRARRFATTIGIAPEGLRLTLGAAAAGLIVLLAGGLALRIWSPGLLIIIVACAIGAFFRDPERKLAGTQDSVVAPADGKVTYIGDAAFPGDEAGSVARCVSIFMSPLDVHINRSPVSGEVVRVYHTPGDFRAAFRDEASQHNERNLIIFAAEDGRRYAIVQIAGYLARRIICRVHEHERVERGERVGLIMFGSRVDVFMPAEFRVTVKIGQQIRGGESIIGELA